MEFKIIFVKIEYILRMPNCVYFRRVSHCRLVREDEPLPSPKIVAIEKRQEMAA